MVSVSTTVEVYLDDFDTDQLIAEVGRRKLCADDLAALRGILEGHGVEAPEGDVERAMTEELAGRRSEALIWIERALGRFWIGRLAR